MPSSVSLSLFLFPLPVIQPDPHMSFPGRRPCLFLTLLIPHICPLPFSFLRSPPLSRLPNPTHGLDVLPTHRADVYLPRALLARHHMPAVVEQSIHLALIANLTHGQLLIRYFVTHHPLAVSSALFPPADVHVLRFAVNHLAFAVGLVVFPIANVGISG